MTNIIVYGLKRTGTSLMTEILSKNNKLIINKDNKLEENSHFKELQNYFNEGKFIGGITDKNCNDYLKLNNNVIKIMHHGLTLTDIKYFDSFKKIIVMNRNWVDQTHSTNNLNKIIIKNQYNLLQKNVKDIDEYLKYYNLPDGIEYGYLYSKLFVDIVKRKYQKKIVIVNFEDLITYPKTIYNLLIKSDIDILSGLILIDKTQIKFSDGDNTKTSLKEFASGFFDFLDKLYFCVKNGLINNDILKLINHWLPIMVKQIKSREDILLKKFKVVYLND